MLAGAPTGSMEMDYESRFTEAVEDARHEGRYRVFAHLERIAERYPRAINHGPGPAEVVVWVSDGITGSLAARSSRFRRAARCWWAARFWSRRRPTG